MQQTQLRRAQGKDQGCQERDGGWTDGQHCHSHPKNSAETNPGGTQPEQSTPAGEQPPRSPSKATAGEPGWASRARGWALHRPQRGPGTSPTALHTGQKGTNTDEPAAPAELNARHKGTNTDGVCNSSSAECKAGAANSLQF